MISIIFKSSERGVLKFCYSLFILLFLSCGQSSKKEDVGLPNSSETTETTNKTTTDTKVILFFGNSLTAGYGLEPSEAYPAVVQGILDSLDFNYETVNAGLSGETSSGGKNRLSWLLNQKVDIFILELGANDGLRGIPLTETKSNLQDIIDQVKVKNPEAEIIIAGMQIPPNMGQAYTAEFRNIFPDLADRNDAYLIPFLLEDVAGIPTLNQSDGIHPTAEGNKIMAQNVWEVLNNIIEK